MNKSRFLLEADEVIRKLYLEDDNQDDDILNRKSKKELEDEELKRRENFVNDVKEIKDEEKPVEDNTGNEEKENEEKENENEVKVKTNEEGIEIEVGAVNNNAQDDLEDDLKDEESEPEAAANELDNDSAVEVEVEDMEIEVKNDENEVKSEDVEIEVKDDENPEDVETTEEWMSLEEELTWLEDTDIEIKDDENIEEDIDMDIQNNQEKELFDNVEANDVNDENIEEDWEWGLDLDLEDEIFNEEDTNMVTDKVSGTLTPDKDEKVKELKKNMKKTADTQIDNLEEDIDIQNELKKIAQEAADMFNDFTLEEDLEISENIIDDVIESDLADLDTYEFDIFGDVENKSKNYKRKDVKQNLNVWEDADMMDGEVEEKDEESLEEWLSQL